MKNIKWCFLSILLFLISCKSVIKETEVYRTEDREKAPISVSIEPQHETLYFSSLFSSGKVIELSGCTISNIEKVILLADGRLVVVASRIFPGDNSSIISSKAGLFSSEGVFLAPLLRIGNGPNEVINVQDVKVNPFKKSLDVLSDFGRKILRFDIDSQEIVEIIPIDSMEIVCGEGFLPLYGNKFLIYKNLSHTKDQEYKLYLFDATTGKVLDRFLPFDKQTAETLSHFEQRNNLCEVGDDLFFSEGFMNTLYKFKEGDLVPYVGFRDNKYSLPDELLHRSYTQSFDLIEEAAHASKIYFHGSFFFSAGKIFSTYKYLTDQQYFNVISCDEQKSISYDSICDDICTGISASCKEHKFSVVATDSEHVFFKLETDQNPLLLIMDN